MNCAAIQFRNHLLRLSYKIYHVCYLFYLAGIGFTQNSFTVVEGDSVDVTIFIETDDGLALDNNQDVTCIISDDASSQGNPALPLNRLIGDISSDAQGNPTVTFTVPVGTEDASELSFTGLSIENNNIMENTDLDFNLLIDGFSILQTTGGGISGFTTVTVEDDDDGECC